MVKHPQRAVLGQRYRARGLKVVNTLTVEQWVEILDKYDNACAYCGYPGTLIIEHQTPLSRGGENVASNIVPACHSCNAKKRDLTVEEWTAGGKSLRTRGNLGPKRTILDRHAYLPQSTNELTKVDLLKLLRQECEAEGSQSAWAKKHGFSRSFITDVLKERRDISDNLASALGYMKCVVFFEMEKAD